MMGRITAAQAAQDVGGLLDGRFFHHHRLEATFERGVRLDVLAILVEGGRADALQFAARELRFDHAAQVERTFGRAGADQRVQFVDEEHDVARRALDLVQDLLDAALELAAILGPRDQRSEREREDFLAAQSGRDVAADDALCEAFDDRRLADAGPPTSTRLFLPCAPGSR